ncbi:hypothetical protein [Ideonella sp.]|jgi:hypothetical protein|uniref:hypothetical protein n=1 Tax=Ideonella sp. TaxID=1929293 RepID=UPI0037C06F3B
MAQFALTRRLVLLMSVGLFGATAQAAVIQTAYYVDSHGRTNTFLVDWNNTKLKADIVDGQGKMTGTYTDDGTRRIVTLTIPRVFDFPGEHFDSCGQPATARSTETRFAFLRQSGTERSGTTAISADTSRVVVDGCDAGLVLSSTSIDDITEAQSHLRMSARPSMSDTIPGARWAGFSETPRTDLQSQVSSLGVDLTTLLTGGSMQFARTGTAVPAAVNSQGWLMLSFPSFSRGYTRLKVDTSTGAETWLMADFVADKPAWVQEILVTRSLAGGTFGTLTQAARQWNSGLFVDTNNPFLIYLYRDGTGERIFLDLAAGTEMRAPIDSWVFDGPNIVQTRRSGVTSTAVRTWEPIGNLGKIRWVLEREFRRMSDGSELPFIAPRVNFYIDTGRATPLPPPLGTAARSSTQAARVAADKALLAH